MPLWRFLGAPWVLLSGAKKPLRALYCSEMLFFRFQKAPAGTLLLRNVIFRFKKTLRARYCSEMLFSGSKKPLRARYCSEMLFFRFKKAPAGTLLLRNAIFQVQKGPCGHVTAQKCYFSGSKKPLRACCCSEIHFSRYMGENRKPHRLQARVSHFLTLASQRLPALLTKHSTRSPLEQDAARIRVL